MASALLEILHEECFPGMKLVQIEKTFGQFTDDELLEIIQAECLQNEQ